MYVKSLLFKAFALNKILILFDITMCADYSFELSAPFFLSYLEFLVKATNFDR